MSEQGWLWKADRIYGNQPVRFKVLSQTAKTWHVQRDDPKMSGYKTTVRSADIGGEWFLGEGDAWLAIVARCEREVKYAAEKLQRHRTELGMSESGLRRFNESRDAA